MIFTWAHSQNSSEKKEQIDYSSFSDDQLLDQFKIENWSKLEESDRIDVIQEMENRNAAQQGREPAEVVSSSRVTSYGSYNSMNNQMNVNVNNFSSYETMDTFVHESNHAYQAHCVENGVGYDEYTRNMIEVESMRDENGALYNYARTSPQYDMQCNELDSNNRAAEFLISESDRYKTDQEYKDYIAERDGHFKVVNYALDNYQGIRTSMQNDQAYASYVRGDISQEQYDNLSAGINNSNYVDSTVTESHSLGESLSDLNAELNYLNDMDNEASIDADTSTTTDAGIDNGESEDNSVTY
jgi:hypothetical protein